MFIKFIRKIKNLKLVITNARYELKHAAPYVLKNVTSCYRTGKHLLEIKISGKGQQIFSLAEDVATDNNFIESFKPADIRTICYLAACDKYEKILEEEKIKKIYEVIRSSAINGVKAVQLRNRINSEITVIPVKDFTDKNILESLESRDVYQIGYLAGQEQTIKDAAKMRVIKSQQDEKNR